MARTYRRKHAKFEYGWVLTRAARIQLGYWQRHGSFEPIDRKSKEGRLHIHLLGDNARSGVGTKITSAIVGIDLGSRLVVTHSGSIYKLVGDQGEGEPTMHQLLQVCGAMWSWGRGNMLGVTHVGY